MFWFVDLDGSCGRPEKLSSRRHERGVLDSSGPVVEASEMEEIDYDEAMEEEAICE